MAPRDVFPDRNAQIIAKRKAGTGPREIARQMNIPASVVAGVLHRANMCAEPKGRGTAADPAFKALAVANLATSTWRKTAADFGVSTNALHRWRRELRVA
jgi:hypothetical protein